QAPQDGAATSSRQPTPSPLPMEQAGRRRRPLPRGLCSEPCPPRPETCSGQSPEPQTGSSAVVHAGSTGGSQILQSAIRISQPPLRVVNLITVQDAHVRRQPRTVA